MKRKNVSGWTKAQHREAAKEHLKQARSAFKNDEREKKDFHLRMKDAHEKASNVKSLSLENVEITFKIEQGKAIRETRKIEELNRRENNENV